VKIIGIEEHFLTSSARDAWSASSSAERDGGLGLHLGEIEDRLDDLSDGRIRLMERSDRCDDDASARSQEHAEHWLCVLGM
jgi:hypothetical protein